MAAYGEAACLVMGAKPGDKETLAAAHRALERASAQRAYWGRVTALEATILELENQKENAVRKYLAALDQGEDHPAVVRRTVMLLCEQGRYADANAVLRKLPENALAADGLERVAAGVSLLGIGRDDNHNAAEIRASALEQARKAVGANSKDYRDYLWLGQLADAAGQPQEAERALRQARTLNSAVPSTWVALIHFLARNNPTQADVELAEAKRQLRGEQAPLALASCYEARGRFAEAEAQYRTALAGHPEEIRILARAALFYGRTGRPDQQEPLLRKLLDPQIKAPPATVEQVRRDLAVLLAARATRERYEEALSLIQTNIQQHGETFANQVTRAVVLCQRIANWNEAIRVLKALPSERVAVHGEVRFLLAKLYEATGDWPRAQTEMLAILASDRQNLTYLVPYVHGLLRAGKNEEARAWVDGLASGHGQAKDILALRVRVLKANGKVDAAEALIKAYAKEKDAQLDFMASLFDQLGKAKEAETAYRAYLAGSPGPRAVFLLSQHLAANGKLSEALALCERAWQTCPPEAVAEASVAALQAGRAQAEQCRQVEQRITLAIQQHPRARMLRVSLAALQEIRGVSAGARELYRSVLQQDPDNAAALNNLAYLLALEGKNEEAAELIERALVIAGPHPGLLDTLAVVYLQGRRPELATRALRLAIVQTDSPIYYYHLAQAHLMAADRPAAARAWQIAQDLGLRVSLLSTLEQPALRQLKLQVEDD
jgi:tetratricopeptide (TPR) repeat protein